MNEADRLFRAGDAAGSIPLLEAAYRIGGWPGCLLNLAMAHHATSNCEIARGYYQLYLNLDPYTERRGEVTDALGELQARCGVGWAPEPEAPPSHSPPPVSEAKRMEAPSSPTAPLAALAERRPPGLLEWSLLGAGAAAGVGALAFLLGSQRKNTEAAEFGDYNASDPRAREIHDTGVLYNRLSLGFGIGAAALMGTGATLWLLGTPTGSSVVIATEGFPAVRYHGRF